MAKYQQKTLANEMSVDAYFNKIEPEQKRDDCRAIAKMMEQATGEPATMWGTGIVGFGSVRYTYDSGHSGTTCLIGFAARKSNIVLYLMGALMNDSADVKKLGKVKTGKGCIYVNKLDDIDTKVLKGLMKKSVAYMKSKK
jgi:hypothetical protein